MLTFAHKSRISVKPLLKMKNGEEIPHITECNHLGNILSTISDIPQVMFKFSVDLIGRFGFFLPPLYIYKALTTVHI